ncbi:phosphoribosylformylglycinamidine synthase subunit PurL [Sulfurisphaera ohwakuensis]|uniref:Phosphoribosylformylglycinamidine synthase subunit PurL n=1 Tax=Sulfurisphaera ohwakuensis TaxID=69656 RepID=A0A650CHG3_SULOH|nr:phosphoribosylformylglycinamidine synthase subunit PurL [Sulfurisphaera ohwakuensis]MBB5252332.1 phosphoribosylformylglycinamidine synthase [Sulfurisphaera ohwakuensis]QGR17206.1 phosphoribosylformylglycinamidine synthase subunit PurL [Sulfurisphaera ohwakuensis]
MKITLSSYEMELIRKKLAREPNEAEWLTIDALWSEHCSYKSSKVFLRSFPSEGEKVVMGIEDWQDAGALDVGDGWAIVLKLESHNHPSAIDPFNGAATGVGGIIRDIISKGAKPIALLDMIRVGNLSNPRNKWLLKNIIAGIGFYGNSIGVPVVGGELDFDDSYNDNPLVDVAGVGIVRKDKIVPSVVKEPGLKIVIVGLTGLDGLGGASFASRKLSGEDEIGAVQIADPFAGKIVLDVTLEIADKVEAIKDLGGGGLVVGVTEMANGLGAIVNLDKVPLRVKDLKPEEILVSETQERMLFAVKEENVNEVCKAFEYYDYPCAVIGEFVKESYIKFLYGGKEIVSLPSDLLLSPPRFIWEIKKPKLIKSDKKPEVGLEESIRAILSRIISKEWAYSQFDYEVGTSTVLKPGEADSALISLPNGKLLALKGDANPDLCAEDSYECGKSIVAEAYRNLASVGAIGIGVVDHLQFGDPKKPEVYYSFVEAIRGIAEASKFFSTPIVGGKVSFYNENKEGKAIKPTPLIVMAGLIKDKFLRNKVVEDSYITLIGFTRDEMRGSLFGKIFGNYGEVPKARLNEDYLASQLVVDLINDEKIFFAKDINKGGLIASLFSIIVKGMGVEIKTSSIPSDADDWIPKLYSENGGRFIVLTNDPEYIIRKSKGIHISVIGKITKDQGIIKIDNKEINVNKEIDNYYNYLYEVMS